MSCLFTLLLVALLARPAVAGPASLEFPPDRIFEQIRANRQAYEKVVLDRKSVV